MNQCCLAVPLMQRGKPAAPAATCSWQLNSIEYIIMVSSKKDAGHTKLNGSCQKAGWETRWGLGSNVDKSTVTSAAAAVTAAAFSATPLAGLPRHRHCQHRHRCLLCQHHFRGGSSSGSSGSSSKYDKAAAAGTSSATLASFSRKGLVYSSSAHSRHSSRTKSERCAAGHVGPSPC